MKALRKIYISKEDFDCCHRVGFYCRSIAWDIENDVCYSLKNLELDKLEKWIKKTYYWQAPQTMNILEKIKQMKGVK